MKRMLQMLVGIILLIFFIPCLFVGKSDTMPLRAGEEEFQGKSIRVLIDETVHTMDLEEYVVGVLAAEMPASFEIEALKAQAVAARTYAYRKTLIENENHPMADVCSDYSCCQAYRLSVQASAGWGERSDEYMARLQQAVRETQGEILVYDGKPIDAVFHSSCAGRTQDAVQVWGAEVPYLQSVESMEGDNVPNYETAVEVSKDTFRKSVLSMYPEAVLEGDFTSWIGDIVYNSTGSVSEMDIGGVSLSGREVRNLFSLRSTHFLLDVNDERILFQVTGYGHGVGMSQYGANAMAKCGDSYEDILTWYYTDVDILPYT